MTAAVDELPASYAAVHRYNGAVLQHDQRDAIVPMAIQPRDFAIVLDVWRYKFLTAPMVHELHWDGGSIWPAQRRLQKMFNAGLLERFRPVSLRGSYPWTYHLGERGHVILRDSQVVDTGWRYRPHVVHEFGHVLHDLQLNAWVLAYRRAAGDAFLSWEGETHTEPPREARAQQGVLKLGNYWSAEGLRDPRSRPVRPDAVIEVARSDGDGSRVFLIEYDRTQRVDKNYEKFRRYDTFLCWWWQHTEFADGARPFVIFVCQDEDQRERFVNAADHELTGQLWHPTAAPDDKVYVGRQRVLFTCELDMHVGQLEAWRLANAPPDDARRGGTATVRRVRLPT
jgi:Replication-relaxation